MAYAVLAAKACENSSKAAIAGAAYISEGPPPMQVVTPSASSFFNSCETLSRASPEQALSAP